MSELGTTIMAAGLVDEGMAVEAMEAEIAKLKALVESKTPVCPHCKLEMTPVHFEGYYDERDYWQCKCSPIPGAILDKGCYS